MKADKRHEPAGGEGSDGRREGEEKGKAGAALQVCAPLPAPTPDLDEPPRRSGQLRGRSEADSWEKTWLILSGRNLGERDLWIGSVGDVWLPSLLAG